MILKSSELGFRYVFGFWGLIYFEVGRGVEGIVLGSFLVSYLRILFSRFVYLCFWFFVFFSRKYSVFGFFFFGFRVVSRNEFRV